MSSGAIVFDSRNWLANGRIRLLSTEAEGCYIRLLAFCWVDGSLSADPSELATLCKGASLAAVESAAALFESKDGRLISSELDRQRRRAHRSQKTKLSDFRQMLESNSYRARKAGVVDALTLEEWGRLLASTRWRCAWCGSADNIQLEHLIPISRGGGNTVDNVCPMCSDCNFSKGAKTALEWIWQK